MHITTNFIIICEKAFLTANSNNLNLIGIFSQINAAKFPANYPQFALVVNFDIDQVGSHTLSTSIFDPAGKQVTHTEMPITVTVGNMQVIANFEHMQFASPGTYRIDVSLDDQAIGTRTLQINPVVLPGTQKTNIA